MKKSVLLLFAIAAVGSSLAQTKDFGLSDFTVSYPRNPLYEGDTIRYSVTVTNYGETIGSGYVGNFVWGTRLNWRGEEEPNTSSISLGWSAGLNGGESRVVESFQIASFGNSGIPYGYLNADDNSANDSVFSDVNLTVVRAYANELSVSDLVLDDNGSNFMLYVGHTVTVKATITNSGREQQTGTASLKLSGTEIGTYDYSIAPEATDTATFSFEAPSGTYQLSVELAADEKPEDDAVSQLVVFFTEGRMNESFEELTYDSARYQYNAPEGWTSQNWNFSAYGAGHGKVLASTYNLGSQLTTPKLQVSESDSLSFWAKASNSTALGVMASLDFQNWTLIDSIAMNGSYQSPWESYTVYFNSEKNADFAGKRVYIAFRSIGENQYPSISLDCVQGPARIAIENDLAVVSVSAASYFEAGVEGNILVVVKNNGSQPTSANLTIKVDGEQLAVIPTGEVPAGETVSLEYAYTPSVANPASICQVVLDQDDADSNNLGEASLVVYPLGGLSLPFTQYFQDYNNLNEVPYWSFEKGWSLWSVYGTQQLDPERNHCISFQMSSETSALAVSPLLNLENENVTVSFWVRRDENQWHLDKLDYIAAFVNNRPDTIGATELVTVHRSYTQDPVAEAEGWQQFTFTLAEGNHPTKGFIVLQGVGALNCYGYFDFDALEVTGQNAQDWAMSAISPYDGAVIAGKETAVYPVKATIANVGFEAISGATLSWSVDGVAQAEVTTEATVAAGETTEVELGTYAFTAGAEHTIAVTVKNEADKIASNNTAEVTIEALEAQLPPYLCEFADETEAADWTIIDQDGNGVTWCYDEGQMTNYAYDANTGDGYNQNDWLISPALYIPAEDAMLSYTAVEAEDGKDSYEVLVAETLRDVNAFAPIYTKTISATEQPELSLEAYAGKTIFVAFRHLSQADDTEAISLSIDDVNVTGTVTGIRQLPAEATATKVYDLMGRTVKEAGKGLYIKNGHKVIK